MCSVCGSNLRPLDDTNPNGPHEPAVTLGVIIDFEGAFEICSHCAAEIGKLVGLVPDAEVVALQEELDEANRAYEYVAGKLDDKNSAVKVLSTELGETAQATAEAYQRGYAAGYATGFSDEPGDMEPDFG